MILKIRIIFIKFHLVSLCVAVYSVFDDYQDHDSLSTYLKNYVQNNSDLMTLYSIGQSVLRRELWVVQITAAEEKELLPNIKIVANIHGNEPVGREISLELIRFLEKEYRAGNPRVQWLLSSTNVHILPCMNPDGFERALKDYRRFNNMNDVCNVRGRTNERQIDLNKNFPGVFRANTCPQQSESKAVMKWMNDIPFVVSLSLHSGSVLVNYPFDDMLEADAMGLNSSPTPDDDVFVALASSYAKTHSTMHQMTSPACENGPTHGLQNGITNGAMWYPINGGMQDYNYVHHGCMELTIELACCKFPRYSDIRMYWDQNSEAILTWASFAHRGVKGTLRDVCSGKPVVKASLMIMGRNSSFWSSERGEFWRPLLPGNYQIQVQATGYERKTLSFTVPRVGFNRTYDLMPVVLRIDLIPSNKDEHLKSNCSFFLRIFDQNTSTTANTSTSTSTDLDDSEQGSESTFASNVSESSNSNSYRQDEISNSSDVTETAILNFRVGASTNKAERVIFQLSYFLSFNIIMRLFC